LTDEQKKIRFRKMLQKRQATLSSESGSKIASNGTLDTSLESEDFQIECDEDDVVRNLPTYNKFAIDLCIKFNIFSPSKS